MMILATWDRRFMRRKHYLGAVKRLMAGRSTLAFMEKVSQPNQAVSYWARTIEARHATRHGSERQAKEYIRRQFAGRATPADIGGRS